jgi:hypothetical protein
MLTRSLAIIVLTFLAFLPASVVAQERLRESQARPCPSYLDRRTGQCFRSRREADIVAGRIPQARQCPGYLDPRTGQCFRSRREADIAAMQREVDRRRTPQPQPPGTTKCFEYINERWVSCRN